MAKAKDLLRAQYTFRKGSAYKPIVRQLLRGEIRANATYIQTFNAYDFHGVEPDVVFITPTGDKCYLFKVE